MNDFFTKYEFDEFKPEPSMSNSGFCMSSEDKKPTFSTCQRRASKPRHGTLYRGQNVYRLSGSTPTGEFGDASGTDDMEKTGIPQHPYYMERMRS